MPAQTGKRFRVEGYVPREVKEEVSEVVEAAKEIESRFSESQLVERVVKEALPKLRKEFGLRPSP